MLLYHGFPRGLRRRLGEHQSNAVGVAQLDSIRRHGLVLSPEWFRIPENPLAAKREGESPKTDFRQTRASFTLVERKGLTAGVGDSGEPTHVELFGDFLIGLRSSDARRLGAVPVLYTYDTFGSNDDDQGDINLPKEILFGLRELRSVAIALARLEAKAADPERFTHDDAMLDRLGYVLQGDPVIRRRIEGLDRRKANELIRYLDTDRAPAWSLVDLLEISLNLFQTADSRAPDSYGLGRENAYYRQREWRIVRLYNPRLRCQRLGGSHELDGPEAMAADERENLRRRLVAVNPRFFSARRLDDSAVLRGTSDEGGGKDFFDFVQEVICPRLVEDDVEALIRQSRFQRLATTMRIAGNGREGVRELAVFVRRNGE